MNHVNNNNGQALDDVAVEEVVAESVEGLEVTESADSVTGDAPSAIDTHEERLDVSIDDVVAMEQKVRQDEEESAHMQLAQNVANIILNRTPFLHQVTKFVTQSIIQASALYRQNATRPNYVVQRENKDTHVFTVDVISFDNEDPLKSQIAFAALAANEQGELLNRHDAESWKGVKEVSPEVFASLIAQLVDLKAIPGDRFFGTVYAPQEKQEAPPTIIDELAGVDNLNLPAEPAPEDNSPAAESTDAPAEESKDPV